MNYQPSMIGDKDNVRYALVQKGEEKTLYVIALNPSTANDSKADHTMRKIMGFAERNGFDCYVMMNLYPQRSTSPDNLDMKVNDILFEENLRYIEKFLSGENAPVVLLCYGVNICIRSYLCDSLAKIREIGEKYNAQWKCIGTTKDGEPLHPSRPGYCKFVDYKFSF